MYLGTAGWTLPRSVQDAFPGDGAHLARYARVFTGSEINVSFRRTPRASTYARWAASVPPAFRFSVKMPRSITHERRLERAGDEIDAFLATIAPLGARLGCLLVQLPPSLSLAAPVGEAFFAALRARYAGDVALEARHATWFDASAAALLAAWQVARVTADPPRARGAHAAGPRDLAYWRLHGAPRTYYSAYDDAYLAQLARAIVSWRAHAGAAARAWCIFDNTASGAAASDALALRRKLAQARHTATLDAPGRADAQA